MVSGQDPAHALAGGWLYKQGDLLLGPVTGAQLLERLYAGEVTGATEVAPLGERTFRPLAQLEPFRPHLARAEAKWRVDAEAARARQRRKRRLVLVGSGLGVLTLVLAVGAWRIARWAAVHGPLDADGASEVADISVEPPTITLARAAREELLEYPGPGGGSTRRPGRTDTPGGRGTRGALGSTAPSGRVSSDPDGLETGSFESLGLNQVVATHQKTLFGCLQEEARRQGPGFYARVPIEFVVGNDGRVNKLWIDNPSFHQGPLYDCFLRELRRWPFKGFTGEQPAIALSFTVGRKG